MTPHLVLEPRQLAQLAHHLKSLSAAEYAHAIGDIRYLEDILRGVDPVELRELIALVESAGAEPRAESPRGEPTSTTPPAPSEPPLHRVQASAPAEVVHAGDSWSRKVRCG